MGWMFNKCHKLKIIIGINKFNTTKVIKMNKMFGDCKKLEFLDLSNFNTSNVDDMEGMFNGCNQLKEIKGINNFNISKVINKEGMFQECNQLKYLNLSKFGSTNTMNIGYNSNLKNQLNEERNRNQKLMDELKKERKRNKELTEASGENIAVNFRSSDQTINYPIAGKNSDKFSILEEKLKCEYPELKNKSIYFIANGNIIDRDATLEQNKIKSGSAILIEYTQ